MHPGLRGQKNIPARYQNFTIPLDIAKIITTQSLSNIHEWLENPESHLDNPDFVAILKRCVFVDVNGYVLPLEKQEAYQKAREFGHAKNFIGKLNEIVQPLEEFPINENGLSGIFALEDAMTDVTEPNNAPASAAPAAPVSEGGIVGADYDSQSSSSYSSGYSSGYSLSSS